MNNSNSRFVPPAKFITSCARCIAPPCTGRALSICILLAGLLLLASAAQAATATWTGASGTDTNWSTGGNWSGGTGTAGVPASTDNVVFGNTGNATSITAISNVVDSTGGNFLGTISSLAYTNNVNNSYQNTLIASGVTLNVTNNTGPFNSVLFVGTPVSGPAAIINASIQGSGATLNVNNTNGCISISQAGANTSLATLNMTNLDNFVANVSKVAIGDYLFGIGTAAAQGSLILAKTNTITTSWVGNFSSPYSSTQMTNAIDLGIGSSSTLGSGLNAMFLGLTNGIFTDSINVGGVKSGGSATAPTLIAFVPAFTNSSPTAYFRGISGSTSRISHWGVGDTAIGSGSSAAAFGKVDFTGGSVDIMVDMMFLGRDRNGTAALDSGIFTFTAGNVNINTLEVGYQGSASTGSAVSGTMNVTGINGANAALTVNTTLELGHTTLTGGPPNALSTRGVLDIFNGTVNANNVIVGASSITNIINMNNAMLVVTNTLATNASGLFLVTMTNSTVGLTINDGSLKGLVNTLTTSGTTNLIQLASVPVFPSANYPVQIALIKYTTLNGTGFNFGLTNLPATAPGAFLSNNVANKTIDLYLPTSPAPVITVQPQPFSGNPGDTATLSVMNSGNTPLSYQWYYTNGVSTSVLSDGPGPSGSSTLSGSTSNVLTIVGAQPGDSGGYFVVITNIYGAATSSIPQVTISPGAVPPTITGLNNQTNIAGTIAIIPASVAGNPAPALQWRFNGNNLSDGPTGNGDIIAGSSTSTLNITNVQYPSSQGTYSLVASNSAGVVTNSMTLTVIVTPAITNQPQSVVVTNTQAASFSVVAGGVPAPTYQWKKNGNPILNETNSTLNFASVSASDMATYSVVVQNTAGSVISSNATLTVNSTMAAVSLIPANGATGICYDTPLSITFSQTPTLNNIGTVKIYNVTNSTTPVDTLNLTLGSPQSRTIGGVTLNAYPVIINGNTAVIYPHSGVMTSNQTYYVTIDNGAFEDSTGAYFAGITATNAWQFTTKVAGPANATNLVVAADGSGDFCTVQGAIDFLPNGNTAHVLINIRNGTYNEINRLNSKNNITFRGQNRHQTLISYANDDNINGGTSARPMFGVLSANDVAIENITLTNSTPKGGSQAEALFVNVAKRFILYNADLDSFQDTLLVNANGDLAYLQKNHIQGDTDFIWGMGTAFFTNCELETLTSGSGANLQNITQARTTAGTNGFSFVNCQLTRLNNTIILGGLGRDLGFTDGNVAYINCLIDTHIVGWNNVDARYWEYGNSNLTATVATNFNGVQLTNNDPRLLLAQSSTNWLYGWIPQLAPNILTQPTNQTANVSNNVSFVVVATGISDPTYQWFKSALPISSATNAALTITNVQFSDADSYSVVVSNAAGVVTSSNATLTVPDRPPFANTATYTRPSGQPLNILIANLAINWSDPDGDIVALSGAISSTNGASVAYDANYVHYTNANDVADQINYTVADGRGGNAGGLINLIIGPPPTNSVTASVANGDGTITLSFLGAPNYTYQVEATTDLTPPVVWDPVSTNTADGGGIWQFTDTSATNYPQRFYRSVYKP